MKFRNKENSLMCLVKHKLMLRWFFLKAVLCLLFGLQAFLPSLFIDNFYTFVLTEKNTFITYKFWCWLNDIAILYHLWQSWISLRISQLWNSFKDIPCLNLILKTFDDCYTLNMK
jgi:hypothetical protein